MYIHLIRHGQTKGNMEKKYIGLTDEPLSQETLSALEPYPDKSIGNVFCSPLLRCRQTAEILFPQQKILIVEGLSETNFGDFENKNYEQLKDLPSYRQWLDDQATPPNGESHEHFKTRCCLNFQEIVTSSLAQNLQKIAVITHGGTIMSIMENFALPQQPFYTWQPPNNGGFVMQTTKEFWQQQRKVNLVEKIHEKPPGEVHAAAYQPIQLQ